MAVKIRLSRLGRKNRPFWRIVAIDSRKQRDGACLANLGAYDPFKHAILHLNLNEINEWISKGAQCSPAVVKLLKEYKRTVDSTEA